ncbi:MAG: acyl-CoA dehydrogenase-related protein [Pseudonocardiales bacterium]|nr:acyl-CoA dehydrogenase-related protein [Pseudonocardiales bacterium]
MSSSLVQSSPLRTLDLEALPALTARLAGTAAFYDQTGDFPAAGIKAIHDAGVLTATVGQQFGGAGITVSELVRVLAALGKGDPSVALIASMTLFPHLSQSWRPTWPEHLYAKVLAESALKPTLINTARVEPELGSPARGGLPSTLARRTATGWSISGRKMFVTGSSGLAYHLVWAITDEPTPRVGTFVVPGSSEGIDVVRTWDQLGLRASASHDVIYTDVEIPEENVLGIIDAGGKAQQDNLAAAIIHIPLAALYVGVGRAAQDYFHAFAHERVPANLGRPVATTERFKTAAGEIETLLATAELLLDSVADRFDRGDPVAPTTGLAAKVIAVRNTTQATQIALRLLGNPGLSRSAPLERHFRDVQSSGVHAPQEDTSLINIGTAKLAAAAPVAPDAAS